MKKLKTFENYEVTGNSPDMPSRKELNEKIKEIILGIISIRKYVEMLKDTTEHVHELMMKKYPKSTQSFFNELYSRDDFLAELVESIYDIIEGSTTVDDLTEIIGNIEQIIQYTDDNMDQILNQSIGNYIEEEEDEDEDEKEEVQEIEYEELPKSDIDLPKKNDPNNEDQLKRKPKLNQSENPVKEALKSREDIKRFIEEHREKVGPFLKGEKVYISGIKSSYAQRYNGKECIIIGKSKDKEDCWDLYDPSGAKVKSGESNIQSMPTKFISLEKPDDVKISTKSTSKAEVGIKPKSKKTPTKK